MSLAVLKAHLDNLDFHAVQQTANQSSISSLSSSTISGSQSQTAGRFLGLANRSSSRSSSFSRSMIFGRLEDVVFQVAALELQYHSWVMLRKLPVQQFDLLVRSLEENVYTGIDEQKCQQQLLLGCKLRCFIIQTLCKMADTCPPNRHGIRPIFHDINKFAHDLAPQLDDKASSGWTLSVLYEFKILHALITAMVATDAFAFKDASLGCFKANLYLERLDEFHAGIKSTRRSPSPISIRSSRSNMSPPHVRFQFESIKFWMKCFNHTRDKTTLVFDQIIREKQQSVSEGIYASNIPANPYYIEMQEFVKSSRALNISLVFHVEGDLEFPYTASGYACTYEKFESSQEKQQHGYIPAGLQSFPVICTVPRIFILDDHMVNIVSIIQYGYDSLADFRSRHTISFFDRKFNVTYLISMVSRYCYMIILYDGNREGERNLVAFCQSMCGLLRDIDPVYSLISSIDRA